MKVCVCACVVIVAVVFLPSRNHGYVNVFCALSFLLVKEVELASWWIYLVDTRFVLWVHHQCLGSTPTTFSTSLGYSLTLFLSFFSLSLFLAHSPKLSLLPLPLFASAISPIKPQASNRNRVGVVIKRISVLESFVVILCPSESTL